jgi:two-component system nitrate/nitrite response regulator NarL
MHERTATTPIRVLVADDTFVHTQLLEEALRREQQFHVTSASSSQDVVYAFNHHTIDVAVISVNLDDQALHGCVLLRQLRSVDPRVRSVMLLDTSKQEIVLQAFRAGARGVFSRHESIETLAKCIRSVHEGQIWANSLQMSYAVEALADVPDVKALDANGLSLLSKRELEVVRCLAEGLTNREIADRLGLSQHTVKNYLFRVFEKTGVSNRLELLFLTLHTHDRPLRKREPAAGMAISAGFENASSKS